MKLSYLALRRPTSTLVLFLCILCSSFYALSQVNVDLLPDLTDTSLQVEISYPGATAEEAEREITRPIEQVLIGLNGLQSMNSQSFPGGSMIRVSLSPFAELRRMKKEIRDRIAFIAEDLPEEISFPYVTAFDLKTIIDEYLVNIVLIGQDREALQRIVEQEIYPRLRRLDGVLFQEINFSQSQKNIWVTSPPERLISRGVTLGQIDSAIAAADFDFYVGPVTEGDNELFVRIKSVPINQEKLSHLPLPAIGGSAPFRVGHVADVSSSIVERSPLVAYNGHVGPLSLRIGKTRDANILKTSRSIRKELDLIRKELPASIKIIENNSTSLMVEDSLRNVILSSLYGLGMTILTLIIFLRNARFILLVSFSIPASIFITLLIFDLFDVSLDIIAMAGLVMGIGMIVDSSIVTLESILRYRERGSGALTASRLGVQEVAPSVVTSTVTTVSVFLPLLLLKGQLDPNLTIIANSLLMAIVSLLLVSLLLSITVVPVLATRWLHSPTRKISPRGEGLMSRIDEGLSRTIDSLENGYTKALSYTLSHKGMAVLIALVFFVGTIGGCIAFPNARTDTRLDRTSTYRMSFDVQAPLSSNILEKKVFRLVRNFFQESLGSDLYSLYQIQPMGDNMKTAIIEVGSRQRPLQKEEIVSIRDGMKRIFQNLPNIQIDSSHWVRTENNGAKNKSIALRIVSQNMLAAAEVGEELVTIVRQRIPILIEPHLVNYDSQKPSSTFVLDKERAESLGIDESVLSPFLWSSHFPKTSLILRGETEEERTSIKVASRQNYALLPHDLELLTITNREGFPIPLSSFVSLETRPIPPVIHRQDRKRSLSFITEVPDGADAPALKKKILELIDAEMVIPDEVMIEQERGRRDELESSSLSLLFIGFSLSIILVYAIMASRFESFKDPFIIFLTMPSLMIGAILLERILGIPFTPVALLGFILLAGIVVNNGIVMVDYINLLRDRGLPLREACLRASKARLRPILMTSLTTIVAISPLTFQQSTPNVMIQSLGAVVLGGMVSSTVTTLFLGPVLYEFFNRKHSKRKRGGYAPHIVPYVGSDPPLR